MNVTIQNLKIFIDNITLSLCCRDGGDGTGSEPIIRECNTNNNIRLLEKKDIIGTGLHRSGWPYVYSHLQKINDKNGSILLDDFVEQNFCYKHNPEVYTQPWVGIFHHPPNPPYFSNENERLSNMVNMLEFKESAKNLKAAITLSEYSASYLREVLKCPVYVIKHPAYIPGEKWSFEKFLDDGARILQLGFYLRNTQLINQIDPLPASKKTRLWTRKSWVREYDRKVQEFWEEVGGRETKDVAEDLLFLPPSQFDKLLTNSVVVMEVFDASANNGVLDCIVRNTPLIINKHPAVVEYLGEDYPLYFDHPNDIPNLYYDKINEAHHYMKYVLDKSFLDANIFTSKLVNLVKNL